MMNSIANHILKVIIWFMAIGFCACQDRDRAGNLLDSPTSGCKSIAVDASLLPLVAAEIEAFEAIYQNADIGVEYTSEGKAIDALLKDSVKLIIIARKLSQDELKDLEAQKIVVQQAAIAREAVSLLVHPESPDSTFQLDELRGMLQGRITTWNQLVASSSLGEIQIVFNQPDAGIIRFLRDSVYQFEQLPANCFAVTSDSLVVDYVSKNRQAIGLIGASWISDKDDSTTNKFLREARVASLSEGGGFYQPYQAYIAQGRYPLSRDVIMISREARTGLATGFMAFVAGDKGQRIVLKAGLVPSTMPLRVVEINREPL
jgi:phosphate transport system substrate-binding protein